MPPTLLDTQIRSRVDAFADELAKLVKLATLQAVLAALEDNVTSTAEPRPLLAWAQPRDAAVRAPSAPAADVIETGGVPSIDDYERAALQRAVSESGGNVIAAATALGITRSAMYRRMKRLGVPRRQKGGPGALDVGRPYLMTAGPVSLEGYERLAIGRAIAACDGDKSAAAAALKVGKSTLYRRMSVLGIPR